MTDMNQAAQGTPTGLTCPKCAGPMRRYERSGITLDQCTECRGIFLDRGELERLIEAEDVHYREGRPAPGPEREGGYPDPRDYPPDPGSGSYRGGKHGGGKHGGYGGDDPRRRRRGGFLGDLLDFG